MKEKWISVKEQLPPIAVEHRDCDLHWFASEQVLGFADEGVYVIVRYTSVVCGDVAWICAEGCEYTVTHWMPLPPVPDTEGRI